MIRGNPYRASYMHLSREMLAALLDAALCGNGCDGAQFLRAMLADHRKDLTAKERAELRDAIRAADQVEREMGGDRE